VGVWSVASFKVFERLGCPEVVGLDDLGRCFVLTSYSGRWTPIECLKDGKWLGGLAHADLDPDVDGLELYVGGEKGNVYELVPHPNGVVEERLLISLPGQAVNILVGGELDPASPGPELLAFTWPDGLYVLKRAERGGRFVVARKDGNPERVRDALVLPGVAGEPPEVVTASRNGRLASLRLKPDRVEWSTIHAEGMGMGRVAMAPRAEGSPLVLYSCLDDGRVLRHERGAPPAAWTTETIYLGPQGARGLATGRFHEDAALESVAVFGYSGRVEILSRPPGGRWSVETVFRDKDKGHWLASAELDGRNATRELLAVGFGGRIVMLSRPPGYGRTELADPGAPPTR
jgi:hypothetical protein